MGYRNYIASIPREEYNEIKNFNKKQLFKYKGETTEEEAENEYSLLQGQPKEAPTI